MSLLSPPEPLAFDSEQALLAQLQPGVHGLTIAGGGRKGTFLPSVWDSIASPTDFLGQLKIKAGLQRDMPPQQAWRYTTESF